MKRLISFIMIITAVAHLHAVSLQSKGEYYIVFNIYDKLVGSNAEDTAPALSAYGTNADTDSYVFVAEDAGNGYFLLRQKSSGKYLAASASTSNTWSVVFQTARSTADAYCWTVGGDGVEQYLQTKKNTSRRVGVDGANKGSTYVSIFYDKRKGSHASFRLVPAVGADFDAAQQAYESDIFTNAQGNKEIDYIQLNGKNIDRSDNIDIHIADNSKPIIDGSVNLGSDRTWLIFDNIIPSTVIASYLKYVTIRGQAAQRGVNCRVAIYLNGAAVIPIPEAPLTGYTGTDLSGETFVLDAQYHKDLDTNNNRMRSFILRRGYMATLASGTSGSGYSRVYVADHADLTVNLPTALDLRVSSANVRAWQYLSKKGWANTAGTSGGPGLRATWFWSWSASYNSTNDMEYVPCRQHRYWPSASEVNTHTSSAAFSINEPEHSEQHTSAKCSCGGTIDAWTCTTITPEFLAGGGRIGSPQPTDFSYLTNYFGHVDDMAYRCDFAVTHAYWDLGSRDAASYADWFVSNCKTIWNNTKRPVWLTEMEISASWNTNKVTDYEQNRKYLQELLERIDESPWIERYAIYASDMWQTYMYYEANPSKGLTPAGQVYRDHRATFAYDADYQKVPNWWAPSIKTPLLTVTGTPASGSYSFIIVNPNTDMTNTLVVQRSTDGGTSWNTVAEATDRSAFDNSNIKLNDIYISGTSEDDLYRVVVTNLTGNTAESTAVTTGGLLANPNIEVEDKGIVPGWTCVRNANNGYTKATGDTYLEVWHPSASNMSFNYYQDVNGLPEGVYMLSANVFNSTNGVSDASVGGEVGLYAQTSGQFYYAPVMEDCEMDASPLLSIPKIIVTDGNLRVGVRNIGQMKARWAGADNFQLIYLGTISDVLTDINEEDVYAQADYQLAQLMPENGDGSYDATRFIINPDANNEDAFGWTATNVGFNKGEAYDADSSNPYFDKWNATTYSSCLSQTIPILPAGTYKASVLVRSNEAHTVTFTATTDGTEVSASFSGGGDMPADATYTKWKQLELNDIEVNKGEALTISLNTTGSSWWSADHFILTCTSPVATNVSIPYAAPQHTGPFIFDLNGRRSSLNRSGVLIFNGRKILNR